MTSFSLLLSLDNTLKGVIPKEDNALKRVTPAEMLRPALQSPGVVGYSGFPCLLMKSSLDRKTLLLTIFAFLIFLLPRVIGLGWDITSYDCRYWRPRMRNFWDDGILGGDLRETYQKYHPGVTLMWVSGAADRAFDAVGKIVLGHNLRYMPRWYPLRHFAAKFPLVLLISVAGAICFYFIRELTDTKFALLFAFLLSLEPFFLGTSRFLHLSGLTAMLMFASFVVMYFYVKRKNPKVASSTPCTRSGTAVSSRLEKEAGATYSQNTRQASPATTNCSSDPCGRRRAGDSKEAGQGPAATVAARPWRACSANRVEKERGLTPNQSGHGSGQESAIVRSKKFLILSGVLYGLAVLTKMDGVLGGIAALALIPLFAFDSFEDLRSWKIWRRVLVDGFIFGGVSIVIFFALWPALWFGPVEVIRDMIGGGIYETAFSSGGAMMLVPTDYLYYFEAFFLRSLPTSVILFLLFPIFYIKGKKTERKNFVTGNFVYLFVVWLLLSIPEKTKDRYLVNFSPGIAVLLAYTFYEILDRLRKVRLPSLFESPLLRLDIFFVVLIAGFYALTIYRYHPVYSFYYNDMIGGPGGIPKLGLKIINRGEWWAQAAQVINKHAENNYDEPVGNFNAIVPDREQRPSFKFYFKGKTYTDSKMMPDGYDAHYVATRIRHLHEVPETCELIKEVGPRDPLGYTLIYVFSCGRTVDNSYKFTAQPDPEEL